MLPKFLTSIIGSRNDRLLKTYRELDYETVILPKVSVEERADFVLRTLR